MTIDLSASIAVTRFGLGARPGEIDRARANPREFLLAQIRPAGALQPQPAAPNSAQRLSELRDYQRDRKQARQSGDPKSDPVMMFAKLLRQDTAQDFLARARLAATTSDGFAERWALFWANHFTVSAVKGDTATLVGPFEQEAIRPHVFGRFEDMLVASTKHPAMLLYLDQAQSVGPGSFLAQKAALNQAAHIPGLNENLGREIMELHTVGVDAGYTQADVTEFARALTGWSLGRLDHPEEPRGFMFRPYAHEPGARLIMGRRYAQDGEAQARAVLGDLAADPHTARHLATKIARHFVSDTPSQVLTNQLAKAFETNGGRLDEVARALIASPEAWVPAGTKFKTPYEFLVSSWRAADAPPTDIAAIAHAMTILGQRPFSAPSPKGWPEDAQAWCAPDSVIKRMAWSESFAAQSVAEQDPIVLAQNALGARLTPAVSAAVSRAETRAEGFSILLMSPEFQRR
ncbi:MAG TPA: DUF1800 family protein [Caulobacteraceae bacterium]|jgi:uncharacterized protein (DUF1800 family)